MAKTKFKNKNCPGALQWNDFYWYYQNKFYNYFMSNYEFEGLDYQQSNFLLRKFWKLGNIAAFRIKNTDILGLAEFTEQEFNMYDYPIRALLINERGVPFIPSQPLLVDEEVVIGYAQKNHKSVFSFIDLYCKKLANVEMAIKTNLNVQKTPWIIANSDPQAEAQLKAIFENVENGEEKLYINAEDVSKIQTLVSGAPYLIDKLYSYKQALENEVLTFLGINNIGITEKKEHLINSEVEANNEVVDYSYDNFISAMEDFFERIKEVLGFDVKVKNKHDKVVDEQDFQFSEDSFPTEGRKQDVD